MGRREEGRWDDDGNTPLHLHVAVMPVWIIVWREGGWKEGGN